MSKDIHTKVEYGQLLKNETDESWKDFECYTIIFYKQGKNITILSVISELIFYPLQHVYAGNLMHQEKLFYLILDGEEYTVTNPDYIQNYNPQTKYEYGGIGMKRKYATGSLFVSSKYEFGKMIINILNGRFKNVKERFEEFTASYEESRKNRIK